MINLPLHHIGVATRNIEHEFTVFRELGYHQLSEPFTDPFQKIRGMLIAAPGHPTLELLENIGTSGPLDAALRNGIKFYHFAYASGNIESDLNRVLKIQGSKLIVPLCTAQYFHKVCFLMLPNMMLIELVANRANCPLLH